MPNLHLYFRASFNNDATQMRAFINQAIAETNQGYANSKVPITMSLKCMIASSVLDNIDTGKMLSDFLASSRKISRGQSYKTFYTFGQIYKPTLKHVNNAMSR